MAHRIAQPSHTAYTIRLVGLIVLAAGCESKELAYRVTGPLDPAPAEIGPLRIEALPIDTAELAKDHPFAWRGLPTAGFMLFDVKITNGGGKDLLYLVGHPDFPALVTPHVSRQHLMKEGAEATGDGSEQLIGADQLDLAVLTHEKAAIFLEEGYRYEVLNRHEFFERYMYLCDQEMHAALGLAYIPYAGGFMASSKIRGASKKMHERSMQAEQMVLRPGVVPANTTVRGYLVFAWPPAVKPCGLSLRLPVQPGQAASLRYNIISVDRTKAPDELGGQKPTTQPAGAV
jgi:hypothetical protein